MKYALINTDRVDTVSRYLPANYDAVPFGPFVLVYGTDNRGWTLEDYVLPRLASGLFYPVPEDQAQVEFKGGVLSLVDPDEPFDPPAAEVWVLDFEGWRASYTTGFDPGWEAWWDIEQAQEDVYRVLDALNSAWGQTWIIDPDLDYQKVLDTYNRTITTEELA